MPSEIKVYKVFIASPQDVLDERDVVRGCCEALNSDPLVRRDNIRFVATGGGDALPSAERPQSLIESEVADCDIFVCILHRRLDTPSERRGTGILEEFNLAQKLWFEDKSPHILLYFKEVASLENDLKRDPRLQQVTAFKNRIDSQNLLLFCEFKNTDDFKTLFEKQMRLWLHSNVPGNGAAAFYEDKVGDTGEQNRSVTAPALSAEKSPEGMAGEKFCVLHISDLHFDIAEQFDRSIVLDPLIEKVAQDRSNGLIPEIVVVTGDVAATGIEGEYAQAKVFLKRLADTLGLSSERLFIVPGNHDVDRKKYRKSDVPRYENMRELNEELENSEFRQDLLRGMNDYFDFAESCCPHLKSENGNLVPFVNTHITESGRRVALVGLNSAWMCRKSPDEREIAVGEYQVKMAMAELKKNGPYALVVNLLHHPIGWLWPDDERILTQNLNDSLILSGHLHDAGGGYRMGLDGKSLCLQAGGAYLGSDSKWPARFHYITVDWAAASIQVDFRRFAANKRSWVLDGETGGDGKKLFLNTGIIKPSPARETPGEVAAPPYPLPEMPAKYLEGLRANCSYMDVDYLQGKGSPISISLPEIYIPLMAHDPESMHSLDSDLSLLESLPEGMKSLEADLAYLLDLDADSAGKQSRTVQGIRRKSPSDKTDFAKSMGPADGMHVGTGAPTDLDNLIGKYPTLLVEGHPGSGKSTLFKHITHCLSLGEAVGGIKDFLPVLLPLKELKGYFDDLLESGLSTATTERILEHWFEKRCELIPLETIISFCKSGKILFLIDGLDEIGQKARDLVAEAFFKFRLEYREIRIVFSGRPHGIKGEILKKFGEHHVKIENLTPEQTESFIGRWFASIYSKNSIGAEQTSRSMIGEIRTHTGIKNLVDNPLMLTAVCILYHDGKKLPNQRAELYKKFMDHLIFSRFEEVNHVYDFLKGMAFHMLKRGERGTGRKDALGVLRSVYPILENEPESTYRHRIENAFDMIEPRCGLLRQADGEYTFSHLTFQEFLTALHIVDNNMDYLKAIEGCWERENFREVIMLMIGYLSIENKFWANGIVKDALTGNSEDYAKVTLASSALLDVQENRRDDQVVSQTRESLLSVIAHAREPRLLVEAGENLGRLKDPRDLKEFIKIQGGKYNLEEMDITKIEPIELGKYPVTNEWFNEFVEYGGYRKTEFWSEQGRKWLGGNWAIVPRYWNDQRWNCPNAPVVGVCWYEADAFAKWLTEVRQDGHIYTLPSEVEWQAAAAGVLKRRYPWGVKWDGSLCNSFESGIHRTSSVGIFREGNTAEGISDLAGNVLEWTRNDFGRENKSGINGQYPALCGGAWLFNSSYCRCAVRFNYHPDSRNKFTGFRCARSYIFSS